MGRRMSKKGIATSQHVSMGLLCDPRKQEEILNDLWVEWVKLALEFELENIVHRRFPGRSKGAYGRLERWIDELKFIGSDVQFLAQRRWSVIVSWFAPLSKPSAPRPSARLSPMRRKPSPSGMCVRLVGRALWFYPTIGTAIAAGLPWLSLSHAGNGLR